MSESKPSQQTNSVSDVEYENFLVQINDIMEDQAESIFSQDFDQKIAVLEKNIQKQLEQNCLDFKKLNLDSYQEIKTFEKNQSDYGLEQVQSLKNFEEKLSQLKQVHADSLSDVNQGLKAMKHHFSGEVHSIKQCLNKHNHDVHEVKDELKKDIELINLELKKTEQRLHTSMRSHHVWVTTSILAALGLYKVLDVMLFQTLFIQP